MKSAYKYHFIIYTFLYYCACLSELILRMYGYSNIFNTFGHRRANIN